MHRRMTEINWNRTALAALLDGLNSANVPLSGLFVSFYTAGPAPSLDVAIGDYTVAALTAGVELTAITTGSNTSVGPTLHQELEILAGPAPTNETLQGVLIRKAVAGPLWGVAPFLEPVPIVRQNDGVNLDTIIAVPSECPTGVTE